MRRLLVVALALAGPAAGRVVDYAELDQARFEADAARLKIQPISGAPAAPARTLVVELDPSINHETLALGLACSFYEVQNPMSVLFSQLLAEAGPAAAPDGARLEARVTRARSWRRCVEVGEMNYRCITRVMLTGSVPNGGGEARAISVSVERDASIGGLCENLAQGVGVVSREAALQFIAAAQAE
jgi:hypothetical protein